MKVEYNGNLDDAVNINNIMPDTAFSGIIAGKRSANENNIWR